MSGSGLAFALAAGAAAWLWLAWNALAWLRRYRQRQAIARLMTPEAVEQAAMARRRAGGPG